MTPSGPAAAPAPAPAEPKGMTVARPIDEVYDAIRDMKSDHRKPEEVAGIIGGENLPSVAVVRVSRESLTWKYRAGTRRMLDLTVLLKPTADGQSTVLQLNSVAYPLSATTKVDRHALMIAERLPSRFGTALANEIEEIDPEAAKRIKRASLGPIFAEGAMTALSVAANPIAVMKQAKEMENQIHAIGEEEKVRSRDAAARARNVVPGVSFRPGQPMVDPSRPAN